MLVLALLLIYYSVLNTVFPAEAGKRYDVSLQLSVLLENLRASLAE